MEPVKAIHVSQLYITQMNLLTFIMSNMLTLYLVMHLAIELVCMYSQHWKQQLVCVSMFFAN